MSELGPAQRVVFGIALLLLAGGGFAGGRTLFRPHRNVIQPIAFNHGTHTATLECGTCHLSPTQRAHSGLPGLSTCMQCHEEPQTDSPEEKKIPKLVAAGQEDAFRKLFRLPNHVFYTHRRHVGIAGLECVVCHGQIAQTGSPPAVPLVRITMAFCIDCHRRSGVPTDCTRCHR